VAFTPSLAGQTITLGKGEIPITQSITIETGATVTVDVTMDVLGAAGDASTAAALSP